jgi:general nucleoside transport system ATP-binding protein
VPRLDGVSLTLRAGEIVGIAGVSGNGQSELLEVLSGLLAPAGGQLTLGGRASRRPLARPGAGARELKLAHVPEDRHKRGLVLPSRPGNRPCWATRPAALPPAAGCARPPCAGHAGMMEQLRRAPAQPALRSSKFSGGNQQKLVLAREALPEPQVLLVGQPTRGVDIGAIEFIHGRLRAMRDAGGAVLVVSSELDEILALADRVIVMNAGRVAGELPIAQCSEPGAGPAHGRRRSAAADLSIVSQPVELPRWMDLGCCRPSTWRWRCWSAPWCWGIGQDPVQVLGLLIKGAFGSPAG